MVAERRDTRWRSYLGITRQHGIAADFNQAPIRTMIFGGAARMPEKANFRDRARRFGVLRPLSNARFAKPGWL